MLLLYYLISLLTLPLLLFNLIRVIHAAAPGIKSLHTVHDLRKALHILGLLLVDHDWVDEVEVHQADHLILCRLIECVLDVPASSTILSCALALPYCTEPAATKGLTRKHLEDISMSAGSGACSQVASEVGSIAAGLVTAAAMEAPAAERSIHVVVEYLYMISRVSPLGLLYRKPLVWASSWPVILRPLPPKVGLIHTSGRVYMRPCTRSII